MSHDLASGPQKIADAYRSPPWWYDIRGFFILTFAYNSTIWHQIRFFSSNIGPQHLEVACGTGTLLHLVVLWRWLSRQPKITITGIDCADSMLAGARRRFRSFSSVRLLNEDAAHMSFADNTFDSISIANSIHCFPDITDSLLECYRVLKPGGTFKANVLIYPRSDTILGKFAARINAWGIRKGILVTPYHVDDILKKISAAGFHITQHRQSGNCLDIIASKSLTT